MQHHHTTTGKMDASFVAGTPSTSTATGGSERLTMMPQVHLNLNSSSAIQPRQQQQPYASSSVAVPGSVHAPNNPPFGECARSWFKVGAVTSTATDQPNPRRLTPTEIIGNRFSPVTLPFSSGIYRRRAMTAATTRPPRPVSMSPPATSTGSTLRTNANVDDETARHPGAPHYLPSSSGGDDIMSPLPSHPKERDISNDETPKVANKKRKQRSPSYITDVPLPFTSDPAMTAGAATHRPRPVPVAPPASVVVGTDASDISTSVRHRIAPPVGRNSESSSGGGGDFSSLPSIKKKRDISTSSSNNDASQGAHKPQNRPASSSFALYADLPHGFFGGNELGGSTTTTAKITVKVNTESKKSASAPEKTKSKRKSSNKASKKAKGNTNTNTPAIPFGIRKKQNKWVVQVKVPGHRYMGGRSTKSTTCHICQFDSLQTAVRAQKIAKEKLDEIKQAMLTLHFASKEEKEASIIAIRTAAYEGVGVQTKHQPLKAAIDTTSIAANQSSSTSAPVPNYAEPRATSAVASSTAGKEKNVSAVLTDSKRIAGGQIRHLQRQPRQPRQQLQSMQSQHLQQATFRKSSSYSTSSSSTKTNDNETATSGAASCDAADADTTGIPLKKQSSALLPIASQSVTNTSASANSAVVKKTKSLPLKKRRVRLADVDDPNQKDVVAEKEKKTQGATTRGIKDKVSSNRHADVDEPSQTDVVTEKAKNTQGATTRGIKGKVSSSRHADVDKPSQTDVVPAKKKKKTQGATTRGIKDIVPLNKKSEARTNAQPDRGAAQEVNPTNDTRGAVNGSKIVVPPTKEPKSRVTSDQAVFTTAGEVIHPDDIHRAQKMKMTLERLLANEVIAWLPEGRFFVIRKANYLRAPDYSCLFAWGFRQMVDQGPNCGGFYHPYFLRDRPDLLLLPCERVPQTNYCLGISKKTSDSGILLDVIIPRIDPSNPSSPFGIDLSFDSDGWTTIVTKNGQHGWLKEGDRIHLVNCRPMFFPSAGIAYAQPTTRPMLHSLVVMACRNTPPNHPLTLRVHRQKKAACSAI